MLRFIILPKEQCLLLLGPHVIMKKKIHIYKYTYIYIYTYVCIYIYTYIYIIASRTGTAKSRHNAAYLIYVAQSRRPMARPLREHGASAVISYVNQRMSPAMAI